MAARWWLVPVLLAASMETAIAQPDALAAPNIGPRPGYDWNAFFDRVTRRTTSGPLAGARQEPLLVETDPLGVTGRRKLEPTPPPDSFIRPATKDIFAPPAMAD